MAVFRVTASKGVWPGQRVLAISSFHWRVLSQRGRKRTCSHSYSLGSVLKILWLTGSWGARERVLDGGHASILPFSPLQPAQPFNPIACNLNALYPEPHTRFNNMVRLEQIQGRIDGICVTLNWVSFNKWANQGIPCLWSQNWLELKLKILFI